MSFVLKYLLLILFPLGTVEKQNICIRPAAAKNISDAKKQNVMAVRNVGDHQSQWDSSYGNPVCLQWITSKYGWDISIYTAVELTARMAEYNHAFLISI